MREVSLLVYDEVHYLRDAERGVVWEESIALAPPGCRMAFLSATLPNAAEFAGWVAATHGSPCHVVYTDYRPTPLQHYVFPAGGFVWLQVTVRERGSGCLYWLCVVRSVLRQRERVCVCVCVWQSVRVKDPAVR